MMELISGQLAHRELAVTTGKIKAYAEITGDYNILRLCGCYRLTCG